MCIIAYVPKGKTISDKTIKTMFKNNPDGAGIMYKYNGRIEIRKGFMKPADLLKAWHKTPVNAERAIHCRIATSGKVSAGCCHPFPVRANAGEMLNTEDSNDMAIMHNGMIGFCTPTKGINARFSDTMIFTAHMLNPYRRALDNPFVQHGIDTMLGTSRFLIFRTKGETLMFGSWVEDNGVSYSNSTYKENTGLGFLKGCYGYGCGGYNYGGTVSTSIKSEGKATSGGKKTEKADTKSKVNGKGKDKEESMVTIDIVADESNDKKETVTLSEREVVELPVSNPTGDYENYYGDRFTSDGYDEEDYPALYDNYPYGCEERYEMVEFAVDVSHLMDLPENEFNEECANILDEVEKGLERYDRGVVNTEYAIDEKTALLWLQFEVCNLPRSIKSIQEYEISDRYVVAHTLTH